MPLNIPMKIIIPRVLSILSTHIYRLTIEQSVSPFHCLHARIFKTLSFVLKNARFLNQDRVVRCLQELGSYDQYISKICIQIHICL